MKLAELEARGETCTVEDAALVIGISRGVAYEAARSGDLPVLRFGHRLVVPLAQLRSLIEGTPDMTNGAPRQGAAAVTDPRGADPREPHATP